MKAFADPSVARRYDHARSLSPEVRALWRQAIREATAGASISYAVDLGCGTGRFTALLAAEFQCRVIGVDPSEAMLAQSARLLPGGDWRLGDAGKIPVESSTADLVFMSQVLHHVESVDRAFEEIARVLQPGGWLVIRNSTLESNERAPWLACFPEALEIERRRMMTRVDLVGAARNAGFDPVDQRTIEQIFADSPAEYHEKIAARGLSATVMIADRAFASGLERLKALLRDWPRDHPVADPIDLFSFRCGRIPAAR